MAAGLQIGQVEEADLVEDALPGRQPVEVDLGGEVAVLERIDHGAATASAMLSVVAQRTSIRAARSALLQTIARSPRRSPTCTP